MTCRRIWPWGRISRQIQELSTQFGGLHELMVSVQGQLSHLSSQLEALMAAIDNLQAADTALQQEVVTFIQDWQNALANSDAANDAAVQQVATDMGNVVSQLQSSDPASAQNPPAGQ